MLFKDWDWDWNPIVFHFLQKRGILFSFPIDCLYMFNLINKEAMLNWYLVWIKYKNNNISLLHILISW